MNLSESLQDSGSQSRVTSVPADAQVTVPGQPGRLAAAGAATIQFTERHGGFYRILHE